MTEQFVSPRMLAFVIDGEVVEIFATLIVSTEK